MLRFPDLPQAQSPREIRLWTVRKDGREAHAIIRVYSFGRELRVVIGAETAFTRMFQAHGDSQELDKLSGGTLENFTGHGWTRVEEVTLA